MCCSVRLFTAHGRMNYLAMDQGSAGRVYRDAQRNCEVRFEPASIRERALVTRPKTSVVTPAAPSLLRMPSSSAACSCSNWSFHCNRIASFCSAVSSVDALNASGVSKTLAGFFMALSMSMQSFDACAMSLVKPRRNCERAAASSGSIVMPSTGGATISEAIGYLRASTREHDRRGRGLAAQRFEIDAQRSPSRRTAANDPRAACGWPNGSC
jgi:hypothetical protein